MSRKQKLMLLLGLSLVAITAVFLLPPITQPLSYHNFADQRTVWGIPNFLNVVSNIPFLLVGVLGLISLGKIKIHWSVSLMYGALFAGIFLTGIGSAYYHYHPDNNSLVYDRTPMTIVFMSLLSATVAELISRRLAAWLFAPLVAVGILSVWWWHYGDLQGHGDLRLYGLVQFYPMMFIPLILAIFNTPADKPSIRSLAWAVAWYGIAKIAELFDQPIYAALSISGHTLKHLAAATSTWCLVQMFRREYLSIST